MRKIICAAAAAFLCCAASADAASPMPGAWTGAGTDNRGDRFTVAVRVFEDKSVLITYEGEFQNGPYSCSGFLLPLAPGLHGGGLFREKITRGDCLDEALVRLTPRKSGVVAFSWRGEESGAAVSANVDLIRAAPVEAPAQ